MAVKMDCGGGDTEPKATGLSLGLGLSVLLVFIVGLYLKLR